MIKNNPHILMFIGSILKRMSRSSEKRSVIREIIARLKLEQDQEQLYLDSLDILDDAHLDMFYRKLVALVDIIEERDVIAIGDKQNSRLSHIQQIEQADKEKSTDHFNILFDNI